MNNWLFIALMIASVVIGVPIIVIAAKRVAKGLLKIFLLILGSSLAGFPVFVILHNFLYGAGIYFFGSNFWNGGD